ncbi:unnamed protein product [Rotaria magnacalcarata]|uniref:Uncharacterized protein n=1 Tax=Rotaria magnacalcarata TaxID=392030 RepID=A0A816V3R2_9BILA|nr:unnamed protein product [Rotaria magnacalcarata]
MTNIGSSKIDRARLSSSASSSPRILTYDENITISNNNKSNVQSESDVLQYIDNRVNQLNEKLISNSSKLDQLMQKLYVKIDRLTSNIQYRKSFKTKQIFAIISLN